MGIPVWEMERAEQDDPLAAWYLRRLRPEYRLYRQYLGKRHGGKGNGPVNDGEGDWDYAEEPS